MDLDVRHKDEDYPNICQGIKGDFIAGRSTSLRDRPCTLGTDVGARC